MDEYVFLVLTCACHKKGREEKRKKGRESFVLDSVQRVERGDISRAAMLVSVDTTRVDGDCICLLFRSGEKYQRGRVDSMDLLVLLRYTQVHD